MGAADRVKDRLRAVRARHPGVDHAVRAYHRYQEVLGGHLAAAITYFGFLSFFPLLALAFATVGYVSAVYPDARDGITSSIEEAFPSLIGSGKGQLDLSEIEGARAGAGLIGVLGLLYAGLGWLDALRDALRRVFGTSETAISFLRKKVVDVVVLVLLGAAVLASIIVSALATAVTEQALDLVGLGDSLAAVVVLKVLAVALALAVDTVLFAIVLTRLSGADVPLGRLRSGAFLAAVGFEALKLLATFLLGRTTSNPLYATFGVVVGMLVWMYFVSRLTVFAAAWTATEPRSPLPVPALARYETPVAVDNGSSGSSRRMRTVRGMALGAALGAGLAGVLTRPRSGR